MKKTLKIIHLQLYYIRNARRYEGPNSGMQNVHLGLYGNCTGLSGDCSGLSGNCSGLTGDASMVTGDCTHVCGHFDDCEITKATDILDLIA